MKQRLARFLGSWWKTPVTAAAVILMVMLAKVALKLPTISALDLLSVAGLLIITIAFFYQLATSRLIAAIVSFLTGLLLAVGLLIAMFAGELGGARRIDSQWAKVQMQLPNGLGTVELDARSLLCLGVFPAPGRNTEWKVIVRTRAQICRTIALPDPGDATLRLDVGVSDDHGRKVLHLTDGGDIVHHIDVQTGRELPSAGGAKRWLGQFREVDETESAVLVFIPDLGDRPKVNGGLFWPVGLATDAEGNVFVAERSSGILAKYTPDGSFTGKWQTEPPGSAFEPPGSALRYGMAVDRHGLLWTVSWCGDVSRWAADGSRQAKFQVVAPNEWSIQSPWDAACDRSGSLLYVTTKEGQVIKLDSRGKALDAWGKPANLWTTGFDPAGIAAAPDGKILVANRSGGVRVYTPSGKVLEERRIRPAGWLKSSFPVAVAADPGGSYYVGVWRSGHFWIEKYDTRGGFLLDWQPGVQGSDGPMSIAAAKGCVYIADTCKHRVLKYTDMGKPVPRWGS